ncbi:MAG: hypothetical protein PHQ40_18765 [Anaerolineaceae bacterium]|nr:hypothetical protein [Anaerolineaceae bacterium]
MKSDVRLTAHTLRGKEKMLFDFDLFSKLSFGTDTGDFLLSMLVTAIAVEFEGYKCIPKWRKVLDFSHFHP